MPSPAYPNTRRTPQSPSRATSPSATVPMPSLLPSRPASLPVLPASPVTSPAGCRAGRRAARGAVRGAARRPARGLPAVVPAARRAPRHRQRDRGRAHPGGPRLSRTRAARRRSAGSSPPRARGRPRSARTARGAPPRPTRSPPRRRAPPRRTPGSAASLSPGTATSYPVSESRCRSTAATTPAVSSGAQVPSSRMGITPSQRAARRNGRPPVEPSAEPRPGDPDRDAGSLDRRRVVQRAPAVVAREPVVRAPVHDRLGGPQPVDHLERLVEHVAAHDEVRLLAAVLPLEGHGADAHAEGDPSAGQPVERDDLPRDVDRPPARQRRDRGAEPDPGRAGRRDRERDPRVDEVDRPRHERQRVVPQEECVPPGAPPRPRRRRRPPRRPGRRRSSAC